MAVNKITIIGLGLIGSSLAHALRDTDFTETISGVDKDEDSVAFAKEINIIDEGSVEIHEGVKDADIVVIATHLPLIKDLAVKASETLPEGAVITDTGSVKGSVLKELKSALPGHVRFVCGHPIAGTEKSGVRAGNSKLFTGKRCILTPDENTDKEALELVTKMWEAAGANVYQMDADTHDMIFGMVSHLPHVVAYALINSVLSSENNGELIEFAGGGLKDYTRIAASSPEMWSSIFMANSGQTVQAIESFQSALQRIKQAIESGDQGALISELKRAKELKSKI